MSEQLDLDCVEQRRAVVMSLHPSTAPGVILTCSKMRDGAEKVLGLGPVSWAVETASRTTAVLVERSFDRPGAPVQEITEAAEAALIMLLLELADEPAPELYPARLQTAIVRYRVEHSTGFEPVMASMRLAQHQWVDSLLAAAVGQVASPAVMQSIVATFDRYFDSEIDWHLSRYLNEEQRYLHSVTAERARLVQALTCGHTVDAKEVRSRWGIDMASSHLALAVEHTTEGNHVQQMLSTVADEFAGARVVRHEPEGSGVWLWLSGPQPSHALPQLTQVLANHSLRAGIGSPRSGATGFRRSHLEAIDALRIARFNEQLLVNYSDVALAALLGSDVERARWFVSDNLNGLTAADAGTAELRETLAVYYASNLRVVSAAEQLHLHRNTLVYRLQRIATLLGHPVTESVFEVRCALLLIGIFGNEVLDAA